jgi:hypothetical protein
LRFKCKFLQEQTVLKFNFQRIQEHFLSFFQAKDELKELSEAWEELDFPLDDEVIALEELASALRPLELLTKNLCRDQFNVMQADTVFKTAFNLLRRQHTHIGDQLLAALERRYAQRKNNKLISCLRFLSNPMEYEPESDDGLLEVAELRQEMKGLYTRLFPEPLSKPPAMQEDWEQEGGSGQVTRPEDSEEPQLSYAEKLAAHFNEDLRGMGLKKKKASTDLSAEMCLASKTGDLTDRLEKLLRALKSVQASSVESERAFSTAGRFVTKIRNRLGDSTLDNYCFANHKFKNESRLVAIIIFC